MVPEIAIIGYGHVGKAMHSLFLDAAVYDKLMEDHADSDGERYREKVQGAALALICVPTPSIEGHDAADLTEVLKVVSWLDAGIICIKSAVPPGTTDALCEETGKRIVVSPEYEGETNWQRSAREWPYVIVGGEQEAANDTLSYFQDMLGPEKSYWTADATTVELVKYMENAWLAMQVTFGNEFYEIAQAVGADYMKARELWALDPRVARTHTLVFPDERGFGGKCLPKDLAAIIACAEHAGYAPGFLQAIRQANARFQETVRMLNVADA